MILKKNSVGILIIMQLYYKAYTVAFQWLKHLWNHENMFEAGGIRASEC